MARDEGEAGSAHPLRIIGEVQHKAHVAQQHLAPTMLFDMRLGISRRTRSFMGCGAKLDN